MLVVKGLPCVLTLKVKHGCYLLPDKRCPEPGWLRHGRIALSIHKMSLTITAEDNPVFYKKITEIVHIYSSNPPSEPSSRPITI